MITNGFAAALRAASLCVALLALGNAALAQPKPSAEAIDTARIAFAPSRALFGVPSSEIIVWSINR